MRDGEDILGLACDWRAAGEAVVLATVVGTWGSSPRPAGSQMAISATGRLAGSVSGGCVEAAVIEAAQSVLADGAVRTVEYGVTNDRAWSVGLPCGGRLKIFLEPVL